MSNTIGPDTKTWVEVPTNSDFTIHNLPFGIFSQSGKSKRAGIAIGNKVVDLAALYDAGLIDKNAYKKEHFECEVLNPFMKLGKQATSKLRLRVAELLESSNSELRSLPNVSDILIDHWGLDLNRLIDYSFHQLIQSTFLLLIYLFS